MAVTRSEPSTTLWGLWAMSRPSQLLLIVWVYVLGALIAVATGAPIDGTALALGLTALLPTAASVHYVNEYADVAADQLTERTPFSGGSGALVGTDLPRSLAWRATIGAGLLGVAVAAVSVGTGVVPPIAAALLVAIAVLGWAYSVGPALSRRGLGELDNTLLGGLFLPLYGAAVLGGATPEVALAVVPFCLLVFPNLLATQWADRRADAAVGKTTLAVRWSRRRLRALHAGCSLAYPLSVLALWEWVLPTPVVLASLAVVPLIGWATLRFTQQRSPAPSVIAMVACAVLQGIAWAALLV